MFQLNMIYLMRYNILNITQLIIYQRYYKNWITDASEKNYTFRKKIISFFPIL